MSNKETTKNGFPQSKGFATRAIHIGQDPENWESLAMCAPLVMSTTFKMYPPAKIEKYEYGRTSNPNRDMLENCLASLEDAKHCLCYASGLGAAMSLISMLNAGDAILSSKDIYGGTHKIFNKVAKPLGIRVDFIGVSDIGKIEEHITSSTKLFWLESPTNPLLRVYDIRAISEITRKHNVLLVVDNTFLTPYFQRPLNLGADIVLHSLTKYINGHTDVIMGAVALNDDQVHEKLRDLQGASGIIPSPYDCSQVLRSLKTLEIRMKKHMENALAVAKFLEAHPKVVKVMHPYLPSHPDYELAKRQASGHSGMVAFFIEGGVENIRKFVDELKMITLAESLGGANSLIAYPPLMTHGMIPREELIKMDITDNVLRISVGLESEEDLIEDLANALKVI